MKQVFKKLSAIIFALSTFTNIHSALAMKSSFPLSEEASKSLSAQEINYLEIQIKAFENLAPGIFSVDPELREPTKENVEITSKTLNQMIKIFKKYPNLTQKFIEQTQITKRKKLELKLLSPNNNMVNPIYNMASCGAYYIDVDSVKIYIDTAKLYKIRHDSCLHFRSFISCDLPIDDYITFNITHEMGHLINSLIRFCSDKKFFIGFLPTSSLLIEHLPTLKEKLSKGENVQEITEFLKAIKPSADRINKTYDEFKQEIIDLAKNKYRYTGNGFITGYSEVNSDEWLADVFADALCSRTPSLLGLAMRDWLDAHEKAWSKSGFARTTACTLM